MEGSQDQKIKEELVDLQLYEQYLVIMWLYSQSIEGQRKQAQKMVFKSSLAQLTKIQVLAPFGTSGKVLLTFYDDKNNSYRDIELKIYIKVTTEEKERLTQKKLSEFVANLVQLREELVANSNTRFVNKLQVLAVPQRPDNSSIIMGHLPNFGQTNNELPVGLVVSAESEAKLLKSLTMLLTPIKDPNKDHNKDQTEQLEYRHKLQIRSQLVNFILENQPNHKQKPFQGLTLDKEDKAILLLLRQINNNCNFLAYDSNFDHDLEIICKAIRSQMDAYGNLEVFDDNTSVEYRESELDTDTEEEYQDQKEGEFEQQKEKTDIESYQDEGKVQEYEKQTQQIQRRAEIYVEKLIRMMVTFQKLLQSRIVYVQHFNLSKGSCYEDLTFGLLKLLKDDNVYVAYQSCQCIISIIQSFNNQHSANEARNKEILVEQNDIMKYVDRLLKYHDRYHKIQIMKQDSSRDKKEIFCALGLKLISDLLLHLIQEEPQEVKVSNQIDFTVENYFQKPHKTRNSFVYGAKVYDSKTSSIKSKDMYKITKRLFDDDFKLMHIIEQFSINKQLVVQLPFTRLMTAILQFCKSSKYTQNFQEDLDERKPTLLKVQYKFFVYSTQLLQHVMTLMQDNVVHKSLRIQALIMFCELMRNNLFAVEVLKNSFAPCLFSEVSQYHSNQEIADQWGMTEWLNFFFVARWDFSGPLQNWDKSSRDELISQIKQEIEIFKKEQKEHIKVIIPLPKDKSRANLIPHSTHHFNQEGFLESNVKHLKWNFEEFAPEYQLSNQIKGKFKLWKYYLKDLLIESGLDPTPRLHESLKEEDVPELWRNLELEFMPMVGQDMQRKTILKCMILIYSKYAFLIGPLKTMPYWLRFVENPLEHPCRYLALQMIIAAISIGDEIKDKQMIAAENFRLFDQNQGIRIVFGCVNFAFLDLKDEPKFKKELENQLEKKKQDGVQLMQLVDVDSDQELLDEISQKSPEFKSFRTENNQNNSLSSNQLDDMGEVEIEFTVIKEKKPLTPFQFFPEHQTPRILEQKTLKTTQPEQQDSTMTFNYVKACGDFKILQDKSYNISLAVMALKTLDFICNLEQNKQTYPLPRNKVELLKKENVGVLVMMLLINNDLLTSSVLEFIQNHFDSNYALFQFKNTGLVEYLILLLDNEAKDIEQKNIAEKTCSVAEAALKLLLKLQIVLIDYNKDFQIDKEFQENDIKVISTWKCKSNEELDLKNSIFLRYLPIPMVIRVVEQINKQKSNLDGETLNNFLEIYRKDKHKQATLIWNQEMRDHLKDEIWKNSLPVIEKIHEFTKSNFATLVSRTNEMPLFKEGIKQCIKFQLIENEVRCGQYYLRVWVDQKKQFDHQQPSKQDIKIPENQEQLFLQSLQRTFQDILLTMKDKTLKQRVDFLKKDMEKIIIVLKACLLAQQNFKIKEEKQLLYILELIQVVVTIFEDYEEQEEIQRLYNFQLQQVLKISVQTINTAMKTIDKLEKIKTLKKSLIGMHQGTDLQAIKLDINRIKREMKEYPKLIEENKGIKLNEEVMKIMLDQSTRSKEGVLSSIMAFDSNKNIIFHNFEAETLYFCTQNIQILIDYDQIKFYKLYSPEERLILFRQITSVLGQSQHLYDAVTDRLNIKKVQDEPVLQKFSSSNQKVRGKQIQGLGIPDFHKAIRKQMSYDELTNNIGNIGQKHQQKSSQRTAPSDQLIATTPKSKRLKLANDEETNQYHSSRAPIPNHKVKFGRFLANIPEDVLDQSLNKRDRTSDSVDNSVYEDDIQLSLTTKEIYEYLQYNLNTYMPVDELTNNQQKRKSAQTKKKIKLILNLAAAVFAFGANISKTVQYQKELILSGFVWRALQFNFFNLQRELIKAFSKEFQVIIEDASIILINIGSFGKTMMAAKKSLDSDPNQEVKVEHLLDNEAIQITKQFWLSFKRLLPNKILEMISVPYLHYIVETNDEDQDQWNQNFEHNSENVEEYKNKEIQPQDKIRLSKLRIDKQVKSEQALKFQKLFSIAEEKTPELIWNDAMRKELEECLSNELADIQKKKKQFYNVIDTFDYTFNKEELRIDDIFVKHFNNDVYFRPKNINKFMTSLIETLKLEVAQIKQDESNFKLYEDILDMLKAMKNLIQYQSALTTTKFDLKIDESISLFCEITNLSSRNSELQKIILMIINIVLDILKYISQSSLFRYLPLNIHFLKLVARSFDRGQQSSIVQLDDDSQKLQEKRLKDLFNILRNIWGYEGSELWTSNIDFTTYGNKRNFVAHFLNNSGMVFFFMNVLFDQEKKKESRSVVTKLLLDYIQGTKDKETSKIIGSVMPIKFFEMMHHFSGYEKLEKQQQMIEKFLNDFDSDIYENVFLVWDSEMRHQAQTIIQQKCDVIYNYLANLKDSPSLESFNFLSQNEETTDFQINRHDCDVLIQGINTRLYNRNPGVYIPISFQSMIESLSVKLHNQALFLERVETLFTRQGVEMDDPNVSSYIKIHEETDFGLTKHRLMKLHRFVSQQTLQVLTSLLLCLEQKLQNNFNPVLKLETDQNVQLGKGKIPKKFFDVLTELLRNRTLMSKVQIYENKIMFLQLLTLVFATKGNKEEFNKPIKWMLLDREDKDFRVTVLDFLKKALENFDNRFNTKTLECSLILMLYIKAIKVWQKDATEFLWPDASVLSDFIRICRRKRPYKLLAEAILAWASKISLNMKQTLMDIQKNESSFNMSTVGQEDQIDETLDWDEIFSKKREMIVDSYDNLLWRQPPETAEFSHCDYEVTSAYSFIESSLDLNDLMQCKGKLPILARGAVEEIHKVDQLEQDEQKELQQLFAILNLDRGNQ